MTIQANFSGSYLPAEVMLLLDIVSADSINDISPTQKEALIQSGQRHYSDMLTLEKPPSATHEALYNQALAAGRLHSHRHAPIPRPARAARQPSPLGLCGTAVQHPVRGFLGDG